ncbi:hypothetical protein C6B36_06810 [Helicobacter cinaedi]|uniref:hypothetical protein n=1 Tax=Helicobacter cinaedi TaxID=213 RepID=UPI000CF0E2D5|nr:hypothetical protein [Helicobacter cinaedi]AWK62081.1 hypothetical protein C6B36_06810 [Helicobacter cinaedi]QOQ95361.1 hypothetical protein HW245_06700 [Helicobacter cinaedi]
MFVVLKIFKGEVVESLSFKNFITVQKYILSAVNKAATAQGFEESFSSYDEWLKSKARAEGNEDYHLITPVPLKEYVGKLKIRDTNGVEVEIENVLTSETDGDEEVVLGGFATGDGEFIPFEEWSMVWHQANQYDPESYWYYACEYQP